MSAPRRQIRVAFGLVAVILGCEPRVEEPPARPAPDPAGSPSAVASILPTTPMPPTKATAAAAVTSEEPCVEPLPPEPVRTARVGPDPGCPTDPLSELPDLRHAKIKFATAGAPALDVEVAERDADRQRGLMYRTELPKDGGMLFVFERPRINRFWMRNTCISLDMLFIDSAGVVVGIAESTPTLTDQSFSVKCKSLYVLEVPGGFCRQHGIQPGERLEIDGL